MARICVFAVLILAGSVFTARAQTQQPADPLAPIRVLEGQWQGPSAGKPGTGTTTREYSFVLNGHFLRQHDKSVYQTPDRKTFIHEDEGYFGYDTTRKKIFWMQFHSEGLVNEYVLDSVSKDGESMTLVTTEIENLPGFRAKKVYQVVSPDVIEETFWLAPPGQDFALYTTAQLKRLK
jgi:hypothetical protein